eukprot:TRINITY_DN26174_c0_g1_i1.p1 TRINITY_DN26174_c0_g1~~TRINITY_DN26174_c0_g1_i1.p1  ORF type:complete len:460 (-),score=86.98 TRINITY_DN26174_c0_g1_i1:89-1468(-)
MKGALVVLALCVVCWLSSGYYGVSAQVAPHNLTSEADIAGLLNLTFGWTENTEKLRTIWNIQADKSHVDPCFPKPWTGLTCSLHTETGYYSVIKIELTHQKLTGNLPTQLYQMINLTTINFRNNNLTGEISNYNFNHWNLTAVVLRTNQLTGAAPTLPTSLETIDLSENNFYGPIPDNWFNGNDYPLLQELYISHNQFAKTFPQPVASRLKYVDLNSNNFYGELPSINSTSMPSLNILHLDDNHLSSGHSNISNLPDLSILTLSGNPVKNLDELFLSSFPSLWQFFCSSCQLTGSLPSNLPNHTGVIDFRNNQLSGPLPANWGNLRLGWIYLSDNQLTGPIPESWGNLVFPSGLRLLDVSNNRLSGALPQWLQTDPTGSFVFNSQCNEFSGNLPQWCKDTKDCVSCAKPGGDGEEDHRGYLWFLLLPAFLMCCLLIAVVGFFVYRQKVRAGYDVLTERL